MKKFEDAPQFIILHVASNDLGYKKVGFLRNNIKNIIRWILIELPKYNNNLVSNPSPPEVEIFHKPNCYA
jgi:hypothetical protein